MNNFKELTDFLDKYGKKYIVHSDCVEVKGDLWLNSNNLTSLPESFGNLKIGGSLDLDFNKLESLPESFGNLQIGGSLELRYNKLKSLPESYDDIDVKGNIYMDFITRIIYNCQKRNRHKLKKLEAKLEAERKKLEAEELRVKSQIWVNE